MNARFGPFVFDSDRRQITHDASGAVHLTPKAFDLLALLLAEAPRVVRKTELHERLWPGPFVSDATLVGLVKEVRRALEDRDAIAADSHRPRRRLRVQRRSSKRGISSSAIHSQRLDRGWCAPILLSEGENLIGRDPASTVWLDTSGVSRRHARVLVTQDEALLEDLASKNGTCLNDQPVVGKATLRDGDHIQIGPIFVIYHASTSGISTETVSPAGGDH